MNQALVDKVVHAVLYEGYILYPYRASAKKNRQRFTFGRVYPEAYSVEQIGAEPCSMQTQCLVEGTSAKLEVTVRFLHPMARDIGELSIPLDKMPAPDNPDFFHEIPELEVEGNLYQSWQEAVEQKVAVPALLLGKFAGQGQTSVPFSFPASRTLEPILNARKQITGVIVRRQAAIEGTIELEVERIDKVVFKITVRILNRTPMGGLDLAQQEDVLMRTFASTHTILNVQEGAFFSSIDPPASYATAVAACKNVGTWPILVGEEEKEDRDTMVSSPIILYDYPKIAAESPGDLFDAGEIDEILTLRIMTMTDAEKREMRNVDEHARQILERTEALPSGDLLKMHGVMRASGNLDEAFFNPASKLESVLINGILLKQGDMVRVRPKKRADAMDMAIAGRVAMIESIEQDAEDKTHLALVLEDDPGRDLGLLRQPGHRFFYGTDEVEPLEGK